MRLYFRRRPLALALALAGCSAAFTTTTLQAAQSGNRQAEASNKLSLNIAAGSLSSALNQLAQQAGLTLSYDPALTENLASEGLSGFYTLPQALGQLLGSSPISWKLDNRSLLLSARAETELYIGDVKTISAWAPTEGYVSYYSDAASKTDTPLVETPQSISVIGREELDARDTRSLSEALRYTPSVHVESYGDDPRGYDSFAIRGFDSSTKGTFRDGLRIVGNEFAIYTIESYALERIDVMRGPSGALYGQGDAGGVVDNTTKRPDAEMQQEVKLDIGSYDLAQLSYDLGGAVNEDESLIFRLTGVNRNSATEHDHYNGKPQDQDRFFIAPALTWQPSDDTRITFLADYMKDKRAGAFSTYGNETIGRTEVPAGEPDFDYFNHEQSSFGYLASHRFNDTWSFRQNLRYNKINVDYQAVYPTAVAADNKTLSRYVWASPEKLRQFAIDNQLEARIEGDRVSQTILIGLDYDHTVNDFSQHYGAAPDLDLSNPRLTGTATVPAPYNVNQQTLQQSGFYLQDQIKVDDRWVTTIGGRYNRVKQKTKQYLANSANTEKEQAFTGRIGLTYLADSGFAPYISYTEGFVPTTGADHTGHSFDPERSRQYEIGAKYELPEHNALITASLFDLTKTNVLTRDPANVFAYIQTGEVRSRGFEVEAKAELSDRIAFTAGYSFTDAEKTKSNDDDQGKTPVGVPKHKASAWLDYQLTSDLSSGLGARYVGEVYNDAANTSTTTSHTAFDAALRYTIDKQLSLALDVNNLFDKEYTSICAFGTCYYGPGRRVTASLRYRW